jgi:HEPN domain-containing protein
MAQQSRGGLPHRREASSGRATYQGVIAFHCQQAVEKYIKAILVSRQIEFPKTHSIAQLLDLVATFAPDLAVDLAGTIQLTPFGVQIRYPGDFAELLPGEERAVFDLARKTREAILKLLQG